MRLARPSASSSRMRLPRQSTTVPKTSKTRALTLLPGSPFMTSIYTFGCSEGSRKTKVCAEHAKVARRMHSKCIFLCAFSPPLLTLNQAFFVGEEHDHG